MIRCKILERQYLFVQQILTKPEYRQYVRALKWTMVLEPKMGDNVDLVHQRHGGFRSDYPAGTMCSWRAGKIAKMFRSLDQIVNLDIDAADGDYLGSEKGEQGKAFFPAAQRVHSVGTPSVTLYGFRLVTMSITDH